MAVRVESPSKSTRSQSQTQVEEREEEEESKSSESESSEDEEKTESKPEEDPFKENPTRSKQFDRWDQVRQERRTKARQDQGQSFQRPPIAPKS